MEFDSRSVLQTQSIAAEIARTLTPGNCIALHGNLGAGKTQFVRGLVDALGGNPRAVSSPTFVLLNVYPTPKMTVYHLDAYRVAGPDDFEAIGFAELLDQSGVVIVEWADRVKELIPPDALDVTIEAIGKNRRKIVVSGM